MRIMCFVLLLILNIVSALLLIEQTGKTRELVQILNEEIEQNNLLNLQHNALIIEKYTYIDYEDLERFAVQNLKMKHVDKDKIEIIEYVK